MLAKVLSGALLGIDAYPVEVEVDIAQGLPQFATVGLPEGAVKESKDRVESAIKNSGYEFPTRRITINLAPADIKKEGAAFDLPIAIADGNCLQAIKQIAQNTPMPRQLSCPRTPLLEPQHRHSSLLRQRFAGPPPSPRRSFARP